MSGKDCPFCEPKLGESRVIRSGKLSHMFLSNPRLIKGHTLIVPKRHIEDPRQLTKEEIVDIFEQIKYVENKLIAAGVAGGCDIRQHFRPFIKQNDIKIDHVHFHVLPRNPEDRLYDVSMKHEMALFEQLDAEERANISKILAE